MSLEPISRNVSHRYSTNLNDYDYWTDTDTELETQANETTKKWLDIGGLLKFSVRPRAYMLSSKELNLEELHYRCC